MEDAQRKREPVSRAYRLGPIHHPSRDEPIDEDARVGQWQPDELKAMDERFARALSRELQRPPPGGPKKSA
jgi:hypothetical protein